MRWWVLVVCAGCGRFGFDGSSPTDDAAVMIDAPRPDAPPNSMTMEFVAVADTYLSSDPIDLVNNFGADDRLRTKRDEERSLLRFDVSELPAAATVFAVDLRLVPEAEAGEAGGTFRVHPVLQAWTEGTGEGSPGFANWTMRTAIAAWTNEGASPPISAGSMVTTFMSDGLTTLSIALPPALVELWVDQPLANFGIVLMAVDDDSELRIRSREAGDADRPTLVVTYVPDDVSVAPASP